MAFKSITEFNEDRYGGMFLLPDDGDNKDVVFMYRDLNDVLVADVHYIKSPEYSGYVHCLGRGCPACAKNIRTETKLFIPLYVIEDDQVLFWDRGASFQNYVLDPMVFSKYPNPNDFVFNIVRRGERGDSATRYEVTAIAHNTDELKYDAICKKFNISFPDYYEKICKSWTSSQYRTALDSSTPGTSGDDVPVGNMPEYKLTPRAVTPSVELPDNLVDSAESSVDKVSF